MSGWATILSLVLILPSARSQDKEEFGSIWKSVWTDLDVGRFEVVFENKIDVDVNLIWINYEGKEVVEGTIAAGGKANYYTYPDHLWIFRIKDTGYLLRANINEEFFDIFNGANFDDPEGLKVKIIAADIDPECVSCRKPGALRCGQPKRFTIGGSPLQSSSSNAGQSIFRGAVHPQGACPRDKPCRRGGKCCKPIGLGNAGSVAGCPYRCA